MSESIKSPPCVQRTPSSTDTGRSTPSADQASLPGGAVSPRLRPTPIDPSLSSVSFRARLVPIGTGPQGRLVPRRSDAVNCSAAPDDEAGGGPISLSLRTMTACGPGVLSRAWRRRTERAGFRAERRDQAPSSALHGTHREARDEAFEEEIEGKRDRNCNQDRRGLKRLPEEHVPAYQLGGNADADRLGVGWRDERQCVDELVRGEREGKDHHGDDAGQGERDHDPGERTQTAVAVDHRLFLQIPRHRLEKSHEEPHRDRDRDRGIDHDEGPGGVLEAEDGDDPRQRDEQKGGRHQVDEEDRYAERAGPRHVEAGEAVGGGGGGPGGGGPDPETDPERVAGEGQERGLVEQVRDVLAGGIEVEDERVVLAVVEVGVALEGRDRAPDEGQRGHQRGDHGEEVEPDPPEAVAVGRSAPGALDVGAVRDGHATGRRNPWGDSGLGARHQKVSIRLTERRIATAATRSSGNRNTAIAAPCARSPLPIPFRNA